jgi:hypothetical protein
MGWRRASASATWTANLTAGEREGAEVRVLGRCENCEAGMGVGRGAYLSWRRPCAASSPAARGGGGRGDGGARNVSASEGTTAAGPEARARGVVRSRNLQTTGLNFSTTGCLATLQA